MTIESLSWGVKQSFRAYVEGSGGTVTVRGAATRADDGGFLFPAQPGGDLTLDAEGRPTGAARFRGEVAFDAHGGMLQVVLTDPGVETGPNGLVLTAVELPGRDHRVEVARLDAEARHARADGSVEFPATITLDGMMLIANHYPPGTALDPVRLVP